jgi:hypothetical protein
LVPAIFTAVANALPDRLEKSNANRMRRTPVMLRSFRGVLRPKIVQVAGPVLSLPFVTLGEDRRYVNRRVEASAERNAGGLRAGYGSWPDVCIRGDAGESKFVIVMLRDLYRFR